MKASEDAARHVLDSLGDVGNTRRVEHANFAVLRTSDMPAMLVETAYISNPTEERLLTDPSYQRKLATAIPRGVRSEEHTSELQSLMRTSYAALSLKKKKLNKKRT